MAETVDVTIPLRREVAERLAAPDWRERLGALLNHALAHDAEGPESPGLRRAISLARRAAGLPGWETEEQRAAFAERMDRALRACQEAAVAAGISAEEVEEELRVYNAERRTAG